jgi:hypothetical protein
MTALAQHVEDYLATRRGLGLYGSGRQGTTVGGVGGMPGGGRKGR